MDPLTMAFLVQGAVSIIGGIMANDANKAAAAKQRATMQRLMEKINALPIPDIEKQKLQLKYFRSVGILNPRLEKEMLTNPSAFKDIGIPQELIDAQNESLRGIREIYKEEGLTSTDKFRLAKSRMETATVERGRREAIFQNMRQRGLGGSGMELAANMIAQQQGAQRRSMEGLGVEAMAEERALQALRDAGSLSGQMRGQEADEQLRQAQGLDLMERFNVQSQQQLEGRNMDRLNQAEMLNLAEKQRIADQNIGIENYQQQYNKELEQQKFANEMAKLGITVPVQQTIADTQRQEGQAEAQMYSDVASGVGKGVSAYGTYKQKGIDRQADRDWYAEQRQLDRDAWGGPSNNLYDEYDLS